MPTFKIFSLKNKLIAELNIESFSVQELKKKFENATKISMNRQSFYIRIDDGKRGPRILEEIPSSLRNGGSLIFKDLGPQIGWSTVFFVEYFGPLTAYPFFLYFYPYIYGESGPLSFTQKVAMILFILHFIKREYETLFVHQFSKATMPLINLFKNTSYYTICAYLIAYFVLHPNYTNSSNLKTIICALLFIGCMIGNYYCHIILKNLRPPGTKIRRIPRGFLFEYVTCPNYFFEILQWIIYTIMIEHYSGAIFTFLGAYQMTIWAKQKHIRYKKEFADYPKDRKILIPFLF